MKEVKGVARFAMPLFSDGSNSSIRTGTRGNGSVQVAESNEEIGDGDWVNGSKSKSSGCKILANSTELRGLQLPGIRRVSVVMME